MFWRGLLLTLLLHFSLAASDPESPARYRVRVETTKGVFVLEANRALAPHGADRFYHLVKQGFYNDSRFFRVIARRFAQFGIAGNPAAWSALRDEHIAPDPEKVSNQRSAFGFAMVTPDARTTQIFICTNDSMKKQDGQGFALFGHVVEGMDVVDKLYSGYAEKAGGGMRAGHQAKVLEEGNAYLDREFPLLDHLIRASVIEP
jgi:cyclophilin family peptidyl-prolyl cis-trans isomerase